MEKCETVLMNLSKGLHVLTLDSGCTKTVIGKKNKNDLVAGASDEERKNFKEYKESRMFRFGNGIRFPSKTEIKIPIKLKSLQFDLYASVIDANIPLLVGLPDMKKMGLSINFDRNRAYTCRTQEFFDLGTDGNGLLTLPITLDPLSKETHEIMKIDECSQEEVENKVRKVHEVLCHPREDVLKSFYRDSAENNPETLKVVEKVSRECPVCRKF